MKELLEKGTFRNKNFLNEMSKLSNIFKKELYLMPNMSVLGENFTLSDNSTINDYVDYEYAYEEAERYAETFGQSQKFYELFGYSPESGEDNFDLHNSTDLNLIREEILPEAKMHGINETNARKYINEVSKQKGYILGLNKKILELKLIKGVDVPGEEIAAIIENNLDHTYFNAIIPMGQVEREFLKQYQ